MNETVPAAKIDKTLLNRPEDMAHSLGKTGVPERRFVDAPSQPGTVTVDRSTVVAPNVFNKGTNK